MLRISLTGAVLCTASCRFATFIRRHTALYASSRRRWDRYEGPQFASGAGAVLFECGGTNKRGRRYFWLFADMLIVTRDNFFVVRSLKQSRQEL
jgi:hypothetical protein